MSLFRKILDTPPALALRKARFDRFFERNDELNLFRGVFKTFAEAQASAPKTKGIGYDNAASAAMYKERLSRVYPGDYPMLFWLRPLLENARTIFDWGGHIGIHYHAYRRYLTYPNGLRWIVSEVPAVVEAGRAYAKEVGAPGLEFTSDLSGYDGADVLLSAGALQYIESPLPWTSLDALKNPPKHLLINKLPLSNLQRFTTLQATGRAFHPYWIFGEHELLGEFKQRGYELVDRWDTYEHKAHIPFHPEHSLPHYFGVYLRRA